MAAVQQDLGFAHAVADAIREVEPEAKVILFGSRARGDAEADSDWDILVIIPGNLTTERRDAMRHAVYPLQLEMEQFASLMYKSTDEWEHMKRMGFPLAFEIEEEGLGV